MTLLGLDFDNTLVRYDKLFYKLALEKGLIEESIAANKITIRNYLRERGQDEEFTLLQGEVYGARILEAEPAEGMLEVLAKLHQRGIPMVLVSHKTQIPYKGPAYNLHEAAQSWLKQYNFLKKDGLNWNEEDIYFMEKKEEKIKTIKKLNCSHYIDDLPEILELLGEDIEKILYDPEEDHPNTCFNILRNWKELRL